MTKSTGVDSPDLQSGISTKLTAAASQDSPNEILTRSTGADLHDLQSETSMKLTMSDSEASTTNHIYLPIYFQHLKLLY